MDTNETASCGTAGVLDEWAGLLEALHEAPLGALHVDELTAELRQAVTTARELQKCREALREASRKATQGLHETMAQGRDAASRLRSYLRSQLGIRNEELVRFGVKPLPRRRERPALGL